jgi:hypothetical protein
VVTDFWKMDIWIHLIALSANAPLIQPVLLCLII